MPVLDDQERAALAAADAQISNLQRVLEVAAESGGLDSALIERLEVTAREAASRVNNNLPVQIDADARDEIRRRLIDLLTTRPSEDGLGVLDVADRALIQAEAVRHVMRDLLQEQPPTQLRDARSLVLVLEEWLPDLTVNQLAELLGISDRQLQRRRRDGGSSSPRMQTVARLVAILRHAWTDEGVYAWFHRPRSDVGGEKPLEALQDPANERTLLRAARSGRVQGGL